MSCVAGVLELVVQRRAGMVSHFLVALRDDSPGATGWKAFAKARARARACHGSPEKHRRSTHVQVGSGYTMNQLREIDRTSREHYVPVNRAAPRLPSFLSEWRPKNLDLPGAAVAVLSCVCCICRDTTCHEDVTIDPKVSFVVEVTAQELIPSTTFQTPVTLRFPRVVALRPDKVRRSAIDFTDRRA